MVRERFCYLSPEKWTGMRVQYTDVVPLWEQQRKLTPNHFRVLADFLQLHVPPKNFDMQDWVNGADVPSTKCGTSACIAGWATTLPFARVGGVKLKLISTAKEVGIQAVLRPKDAGLKSGVPVICYSALSLEIFFGLTPDEVVNLFYAVDAPKSAAIQSLREYASRIEKEKVTPPYANRWLYTR